MLELKRGPLERLPKGSVFEPSQIIGRQASRNLSRGMVITVNHVRERWLVERNARVVLQARGAGFTIRPRRQGTGQRQPGRQRARHGQRRQNAQRPGGGPERIAAALLIFSAKPDYRSKFAVAIADS